MAAVDIITKLFCRVDNAMKGILNMCGFSIRHSHGSRACPCADRGIHAVDTLYNLTFHACLEYPMKDFPNHSQAAPYSIELVYRSRRD